MRFRFTIRDLLWLTVVVAVLAAWWVDNRSRPNPDDRYNSGYKHGFNVGWSTRAVKDGIPPGPLPYNFDDAH